MIVRFWTRRLLTWTLRLAAAAFVLALAAAPTVYFGLPALAGTRWARAKVERALTRAGGAPVTVQEIGFSWKSGLALRDVRLPRAAWDGVECSVRIPEVQVRRLHRRPSTLLIAPEIRLLENVDSKRSSRSCSWSLDRIDVRQGRLTYERSGSPGAIVCEDLEGRFSLSLRKGSFRLGLSRGTATVNGGTVSGSGALALGRKSFSLRLNLSGSDVAANDLVLRLARPAAPLLPPGSSASPGSISFALKGGGSGRDAAQFLQTARGEGTLALRGASIEHGSRTLRELNGTFAMFDGRLIQPSLDARFEGDETWRLMGWTDAAGRLDYAVRSSTGRTYSISGTLDAPTTE